MDRLLGSARAAGIVLLLIPVTLGVGLNLFPNYDARPEYFGSSYSSISDAGAALPISLVLLVTTALLLVFLVLGLRRAPQAKDGGGMVLVSVGLGGSAGGLLMATLLAVPVWVWAGQVNNGSLTVAEGADASQGLASTSRTLILLPGLGGLAVGLTVLGILKAIRLGASGHLLGHHP